MQIGGVRKLVALGAWTALTSGFAASLGPDFPPGTPGGATVAGWERVDGDVETEAFRVVYELYVEPERRGLYAITRYRVTRKTIDAATGREVLTSETEKFIWNVRRGEPLRCFERAADGTWRALTHGSEAYNTEMFTAMNVYSVHRQVVLSR